MTGTDLAVPSFTSAVLATNDLFTVSTSGLTIAETATPEQIESIAADFGKLTQVTQWSIGDLAHHYRIHFPERYRAFFDAAATAAGTDEKTYRVYESIAAFYPVAPLRIQGDGDSFWDYAGRAHWLTEADGRRPLSFEYFSALKKYGLHSASYWLERAATEKLSVNQLLKLVKAFVASQDVIPDVSTAQPLLQRGQVYQLGEHRLMCGDSRKPADVAALCGGYIQEGTTTAILPPDERPSMIWTDPPYGVEYVGKTEQALTIDNDDAPGLEDLLTDAFNAAKLVCVPGAPFYVAGPGGPNGEVFMRCFRKTHLIFKQMLIWKKDTMVLGRSDYHYKHEPIYYGQLPPPEDKTGRMVGAPATDDDSTHGKRGNRWYGGDDQTSVFEVPKPPASREHPTMKPVDLIIPHLQNSSQPGEIVLDLFAGSGSTLIAAQSCGRRAFVMENDPRYAEVIYKRWLVFTEEQRLAKETAEAARVAATDPAAIVIEGTATLSEA